MLTKNQKKWYRLSQIIHKANIGLYDKQENKLLDDSVIFYLLRCYDEDMTEEEFINIPEMYRWRDMILAFSEHRTEDEALEFYKQHKKEIENNKSKRKTFYSMFSTSPERIKEQLTYPDEFYNEDLRRKLFEEQEGHCALCDKTVNFYLAHLHHIDYDKQNCSPENLIFLCPRCHGKTNSKRPFWESVLVERKQSEIKIRRDDRQG